MVWRCFLLFAFVFTFKTRNNKVLFPLWFQHHGQRTDSNGLHVLSCETHTHSHTYSLCEPIHFNDTNPEWKNEQSQSVDRRFCHQGLWFASYSAYCHTATVRHHVSIRGIPTANFHVHDLTVPFPLWIAYSWISSRSLWPCSLLGTSDWLSG